MHHERLELVDLFTDMCSDTMQYIPVKWEYMDSSVHKEHKQSEYMRKLQKCEICIAMFWRSLGKYTEKELSFALNEQQSGEEHNLQKTFILFKEDGESVSTELSEFKERCVQQHREIVNSFSNSQELRELVKKLVLSANVKCKESNWNGKELKVMIAAEEELNEEKLEFTDLMAYINEVLENRGIRLHRVKWTPQGTDEFQKKLSDCEMCLNLYWTKMPQQADEEMKIAYNLSTNGTNPLHLYIFFKEPSDDISATLADFKAGFETNYGHFFCRFENVDTMNLHFILQLEIYQELLINIANSKIIIGDVPVVDIAKISFAANNENYCQLCRNIEKQNERLAKHPDDIEEQQELHLLLSKRQEIEENMLGVARQLTKESSKQMSPRMAEARRLFEAGELSAVIKILNTEFIISDIESSKRRIDIIKKQEESQIDRSISEFLFRVKTEKIQQDDGWIVKIKEEFQSIIDITRNFASPNSFSNLLFEQARLLENYSPDISLISCYTECADILERLEETSSIKIAEHADMLFFAGRFFSKTVFDIDYDPTAGEWMTSERIREHAKVMKRWKDYRKRAKRYLIKSLDLFNSINEYHKYDEDIYHSLKQLTNSEIWEGNEKGMKLSFERWISFIRGSSLAQEYLLSALINYAIVLHADYVVRGDNEVEYHETLKECRKIAEDLDSLQLDPFILLDITYLFEMEDDYYQAINYCRKALAKFEKLLKEDPFIYQKYIASCLKRLAEYVSWDTVDYKVNPEAYQLLNRAEQIYENLYKVSGSDIYYSRASEISSSRFHFRLRERLNYGESVFNTINSELKDFLSSHITSGKHKFTINMVNSPIKSIGIWLKKIRNKNEFRLFFTWDIGEGGDCSCSMGRFMGGTKDEIYQFLVSQECYDLLKESIIKDLYKSWNMD